MTFIEYFKITKYTTRNCLKISGVIFTSIATLIAGITEVLNHAESIIDVARTFGICVLFGNAFGIFIFLLAITSAYNQTKSIRKLYNSIPEDIKKKYGFGLFCKPTNLKYNYPEIEIFNSKEDMPFLLIRRVPNDDILLIAVSMPDDDSFQKKKWDVEKKYGKRHIILTTMGIGKKINKRIWFKGISTDIEEDIDEVIGISGKEGISVNYVS